jgi:hypothetical protein
MVLNTTDGPKVVPRGEVGHINTSDILEPPKMEYLDEAPEILAVVSAGDWCAVVGGVAVSMPLWVALDDGSAYGVVIGRDGLLDPLDSVETRPGFTGYKQVNNDKKEK